MSFNIRLWFPSLLAIVLPVIFFGGVQSKLIYPDGSGVGYITAVAIPVNGLANRKIYLAFNFEAHFGVPTVRGLNDLLFWQKWLQGKKRRDVKSIDYEQSFRNVEDHGEIYTRRNFYRLLERHLEMTGFNGTGCLLRTICETTEHPFYEYNGVFGNVLHILFTPSSSKKERLSKIYAEAEIHGRESNCQQYHNYCDTSLLDLVSNWVSYYMKKTRIG